MAEKREYSKKELGMLFGTLAGMISGVGLYILTGQILFLLLVGLGAGVGLSIGAGLDKN